VDRSHSTGSLVPTDNVITVACSCGKRLKAPASAAGKKARCPGCGGTVLLTAPAPADDALNALYDFSEQPAAPAPAAPPPAPRPACPQRRAPIPPQTVLCMPCGYDTRTGRSLAAAKAAPVAPLGYEGRSRGPTGAAAAVPNKPVDYMAPEGSLVLGVLLSAAF